MGGSLARNPGSPVVCDPRRLEDVFATCFFREYATRLVGGAPEPLYEPAQEADGIHLIHYREDYFASALHEVAHWCIAGPRRRRLTDFGYWYAPDGRTAKQQRAFEKVEYRPQALEWHFSRACGHNFRVSADNLAGRDLVSPNDVFKRNIVRQACEWQRSGLPERARRFAAALAAEFGTPAAQSPFTLAELD